MKKLLIFEDGAQAIVENITIQRSSPIAETVELDRLSNEERKMIIDNRRDLILERDSKGKLEAVRFGKKRVQLSRNG